jgi:iron(III) transport system permease protein
LTFALLAGFIAATIAAGLALIVQRTDLWLARVIPGAPWTLLLVPTYIAAVGWEEVLSPSGVLARVGLVTPALANALLGPVGIVFVLAMSGIPFAYFALAPALYAMGRRYEDAARTHGAGIGRTFRTVAPILLPSIMSAVVIVFAEALGDFGVASTSAPSPNWTDR